MKNIVGIYHEKKEARDITTDKENNSGTEERKYRRNDECMFGAYSSRTKNKYGRVISLETEITVLHRRK